MNLPLTSKPLDPSPNVRLQGVTGGVDWHQIADPLIDDISPWSLGTQEVGPSCGRFVKGEFLRFLCFFINWDVALEKKC